jgi:hypothetical protein
MAVNTPDPNVRQRSRGPRPAASPKPGLMEIVQNNIITFVVVVAVGAGGTVFGVANYFFERQKEELEAKHDIQLTKIELQNKSNVETLTSRNRSIERRLGNQKYLDIQTFFKEQPQSTTPTPIYISDVEIFAPDYRDRWIYAKTTEAAIIEEISGLTLDSSVKELLQKVPVHQWRGRDEFSVEGVVLKKLFPYILVQVTPSNMLSEIVGGAAKLRGPDPDLSEKVTVPITASPEIDQQSKESVEVSTKEQGQNDVPTKGKEQGDEAGQKKDTESIKHMVSFFQSDLTGTFFVTQLMGLMGIAADPHITFSLRNIQKVGPVLYAQVVLKFDDIVVNGKKKQKLFLVREYYLISKENDLLVLETNVVSEVPSFVGGYFDDVNQWLAAFYLAAK